MSSDNVTLFVKPTSPTKSISLENVKVGINEWRKTKKKRNERIPSSIWDAIFNLLQGHAESEVLNQLRITREQLQTEKQVRLAQNSALEEADLLKEPAVAFTEVEPEPDIPLAYKPAEAFSTKTSIVELYRPDGVLMKIHLCTDRFEELLRAFIGV